jgi:hypothetical protein
MRRVTLSLLSSLVREYFTHIARRFFFFETKMKTESLQEESWYIFLLEFDLLCVCFVLLTKSKEKFLFL